MAGRYSKMPMPGKNKEPEVREEDYSAMADELFPEEEMAEEEVAEDEMGLAAELSDEELLAEARKRGLLGADEEEMPEDEELMA